MMQEVTTEMLQTANSYQLGELRNMYHFRMLRTTIAGAVLLLVTFVPVLYLFLIAHFSFNMQDLFTGPDDSIRVMSVLSLLFIAIDIYYFVNFFMNYRVRVLLFEQGLLRLDGDQPHVIRWEQVDVFWQALTRRYSYGIYISTTHKYTLIRSDGAIFKFGDTLNNIEELANAIQNGVTAAQLPRYIDAFKIGRTLSFGSLTLSVRFIGTFTHWVGRDQGKKRT